MSAASLLFAAGPNGLTLTIPDGVNLLQGADIDPAPPLSESDQRALVAAALNGVPLVGTPTSAALDALPPPSVAPPSAPLLANLAATKRRVAILAGDLSRPAPYDIIIPVIVETLVNAGIRPSRIAVLACPGKCGPLLGRAAIHRYGEEICATHEVAAWPADGEANPLYAGADLRIAVASHTGAERFEAFLPNTASADIGLDISLGKKTAIDIKSVRAHGPLPDKNVEIWPKHDSREVDVYITSGGGAPWEETLEEALLSLLPPPSSPFPVSPKTAVLAFSGHEGLGSAHFTRDLWSLIAQANEVLASGATLGPLAPRGPYDPAGTLADCFRRYSNTVLFSPGLAEHPEGEDLLERLEEAPRVAARLALCGAQQDLWNALALLHGPGYTLYAEPLGWRALA